MDESAIRTLLDAILAPILKRVSELEEKAEDVRVWQAKYGEKINGIEKEMSRLVKLVEGLTEKPQKRWDTLIAALIASAVSVAIGLLI